MTNVTRTLSALFESRSTYMVRQVSERNAAHRFPSQNKISLRTFADACMDDSILISGGQDDERAELIYDLIRTADTSAPVFIITGGSPWFSEQTLRRNGIDAYGLRTVAGKGMTGRRQMAILTGLDPDASLSAFWQFAFEVCRALSLPSTVESVASIDWQEIDWQLQLLREAPRDISQDLLSRYDKEMAKDAVKASVLLEKLTRGSGTYGGRQDGTGIYDALRTNMVYCASVPCSESAVTRQLFEALQDAMERGCRFLLVLDNIYLRDQPLITSPVENVRILLSSSDLCAAAPDLSRLTQRRCSVALFHHASGGNAEKLSSHFFGMYERRYAETSISNHRSMLSPFPSGVGSSTAIRTGRDYRLNPEWICALPCGAAFVRSDSLGEGMMLIPPQENIGRKGRRKLTERKLIGGSKC